MNLSLKSAMRICGIVFFFAKNAAVVEGGSLLFASGFVTSKALSNATFTGVEKFKARGPDSDRAVIRVDARLSFGVSAVSVWM